MTGSPGAPRPSERPDGEPSLPILPEPDRDAALRPQMRVFGHHGVALGTLAVVERNQATGRVTSLTVRHGLFGRKRTRVPANRVKLIGRRSVEIEFSPDDFYRLPLIVG